MSNQMDILRPFKLGEKKVLTVFGAWYLVLKMVKTTEREIKRSQIS
jgi:hypothetical protein